MPPRHRQKKYRQSAKPDDRKGPTPAAKFKSTKGKLKESSSPPPILSIHDDVLFEILMFLGLPDSMDRKMAATLTSICKKWRVFVMDTPLFWTTIRQPLATSSYPVALNPFERSGSASLDVYLDTRLFLTLSGRKFQSVCDGFATHLPRFKLFSVVVHDEKEAKTLFKHWTRHQLLSLQTFFIRVDVVTPIRVGGLSSFKSTLLPTGVALHALRSLTVNCSFIPHFSAQAPSVERLEINACIGLPSLETFGIIFHKFPQLQILILQDVQPQRFENSINTDSTNTLDSTSDAELARLYPSINLYALAISLPRLDKGCLYLSKIMKNLEYVEIVNPRNDFLAPHVTGNQNTAVYQCSGLSNLKKLRLHIAQDFVWNDATFISSLPEGIDLELDRPLLNSKIQLMHILNSKKFVSTTVILAEETWRDNFIVCKTFSEYVCSIKPTLGCPTTLILPANETLDPQVIDILGAYLTIRGPQESAAHGLINTSQMIMRDFNDYGLDYDDFEDDDYSFDENQWDYEPSVYDSDFDEYNAHHQAMRSMHPHY